MNNFQDLSFNYIQPTYQGLNIDTPEPNNFISLYENILTLQNNEIYDLSNNFSHNNKIDNTFNFYEEINKLDDEDDETNEDKCLISNLKLDKTKIELLCGHKFNYFYIFTEILNKKTSTNYYQASLGSTQISCPYCRKVFNYLLPPSLDIDQTYEIKNINRPHKYSMPIDCQYNNCINKKTYITPLGSYCKKHYYCHLKNNDKKEKNNEKVNKQTNNKEELHPDWKNYTHFDMYELKRLLKYNNLKVSGTKPYLITRLLNCDKVFLTTPYYEAD